jgi:hypothetical protein
MLVFRPRKGFFISIREFSSGFRDCAMQYGIFHARWRLVIPILKLRYAICDFSLKSAIFFLNQRLSRSSAGVERNKRGLRKIPGTEAVYYNVA